MNTSNVLKTKKMKAIEFIKNNDYKNAFKLIKSFNLEFNKEEQRYIQIAYESMNSEKNRIFYESLNINVDEMIQKAKETINSKFKI